MASQNVRLQFTAAERRAEGDRIRGKYHDRVPVIVERDEHSDVPSVDKHQYLVPSDLTLGQLNRVLRKRIHMPPSQALCLYVLNERTEARTLPSCSTSMTALDQEFKAPDGFLYLVYSGSS